QLASYKLGEPPFDEIFEPDCQTLQTWWKALDDVYDHLSTLAIKILNITLHSASSYFRRYIKYDILNLEESFNLNNEFFGGKGEKNNNELDNENVVEKDPNYNYDVNSLVDEMFP
ncbi:25638_t:CDS:2, partial [Gigaspora margarita]